MANPGDIAIQVEVSIIEDDAVKLARAVVLIIPDEPTCECPKCAMVRQARALLRKLKKEVGH